MTENNPVKLQSIVIALAILYIMTFLSGFLQDTQFNFINYIFFALLFIGGIVLIKVTVKSEATGMTKWTLFMTGISTILLFIFFIAYDLLRLKGNNEFAVSLEALLYLITLIFWILVLTSMVLIIRMRKFDTNNHD